MNISSRIRGGIAVLALAAAASVPNVAVAQSTQAWDSGKWQYSAVIYGYLPTIGGTMAFSTASGSPSINVDASTLLQDLKFTFMGTFDAHNGRWGFFTDVLYLDIGGSQAKTRDFSLGNVGLPASVNADLDLNLKGVIWTLAGEYRLVADRAWTVDALAGARYFGVKPTLSWGFNGDLSGLPLPGRSGRKEISTGQWDGIVGLKGAYRFGEDREWYVPFYADVGTGESQLTWQIAAGIGYSFKWGDLLAMWRYLDYNFKSDSPIKDLNMNGPMFGVAFHW